MAPVNVPLDDLRDEAVGVLAKIDDQLSSLRYAAPEMRDFWIEAIQDTVKDGLLLLRVTA